MASPEASPQKGISPNFNFNSNAGGFMGSKGFGFTQTSNPTAPSPLKFAFGVNDAKPEQPAPYQYRPARMGPPADSQPDLSMPGATTNFMGAPSLPGVPKKFDFSQFGVPGAPALNATPPPPAPANSMFNFDVKGVDFSMNTTPSSRKIATPRGARRGGKR